jgi:lipopolysaccharide export system protein LptA
VGNVVGRDGETIITSENLDLLASEDIAIIYNNVRLNSNKNSLQADKVEYDFETKFYRISMFDDTRVKIKLIE